MNGKDTWQGVAVLVVILVLILAAGQCGKSDPEAPHCPMYSWECD